MGDDSSRHGFWGLSGFGAPSDLNVSPMSPGGSQIISPYLNFDPAVVAPSQDSFIFPEGFGSRQRGRFELAFAQIGGSVLCGGVVGGSVGLAKGIAETRQGDYRVAMRRSQILNYVTKRSAATAQMLGVVALMYSALGVLISKCRESEDDGINTVAAATITGLLYKSTAGWKKCLRGGLVGAALGGVYVGITFSKDFTNYVEDHMNNVRLRRY